MISNAIANTTEYMTTFEYDFDNVPIKTQETIIIGSHMRLAKKTGL